MSKRNFWENRAGVTLDTIAQVYTRLLTRSDEWSLYNGRSQYLLAGIDEYALLVAHILENPDQKVFSVADIGAGDGSLLRSIAKALAYDPRLSSLHIEVHLYNIRAGMLNSPTTTEDGGIYVHELNEINAEHLIDQLGERLREVPKFDLIISRWAMRHFVDPVGAFCQFYSLLKINGYMIGDNFYFDVTDSLEAARRSQSDLDIVTNMISFLKSLPGSDCLVKMLPPNDFGTDCQFALRKRLDASFDPPYEYTGLSSFAIGAGTHRSQQVFLGPKPLFCVDIDRDSMWNLPAGFYGTEGLVGDSDLYASLLEGGAILHGVGFSGELLPLIDHTPSLVDSFLLKAQRLLPYNIVKQLFENEGFRDNVLKYSDFFIKFLQDAFEYAIYGDPQEISAQRSKIYEVFSAITPDVIQNYRVNTGLEFARIDSPNDVKWFIEDYIHPPTADSGTVTVTGEPSAGSDVIAGE